MKKLIALCAACLLVLSGCAVHADPDQTPSPTPGSAQPTAVPATTAPVTSAPVETAAPAVTPTPTPVETAAPSADLQTEGWNGDLSALTLDDLPTQLAVGDAAYQNPIALIAQLPESDTWLYVLNGSLHGFLLRIGEDWKYFNFPLVPSFSEAPMMVYGDFDGDMDLELAILILMSGGDGAHIWTLEIVEFASNGLWTAHPFESSDYQAILDSSVLCSYDAATNLASLNVGEQTLALDLTALGCEDPGGPLSSQTGDFVSFLVEGDTITAYFNVRLNAANIPPQTFYVAQVAATVVYTGTSFGLSDLTIRSLP